MKTLWLGGLLFLSACGFEIVDTGYRGIETRFGEVIGQPLPEGLHFYNPITTGITEFEVREQVIEGETIAFTRDTQSVTLKFALAYYPDPTQVNVIFKQFGGYAWEKKAVNPVIEGSIKDIIGQFAADDLVGKREQARAEALRHTAEALKSRNVLATRLDFTNLDFDDKYEQAVEAKVVAVQRAAEAKNKTVQIEEEAKQTVARAEAEAQAMKIKSQALAQNKGLVEFEAVQKWDGKLPVNMYGSAPVPFLQLGGR